MALSFISFTEVVGNNAQFYADGGVNSYFKYIIGKKKVNNKGIDEIDDITHQSKMYQNENQNEINTRFLLSVPKDLFQTKSEYFQLVTFKDEQGNSPNLSNIVRVNILANLYNDEWPFNQQQSNTLIMYDKERPSVAFSKPRNVGFAFQETAISKAMFWESILDAARVLAPVAANLLTNGAATSSGTAPASGTPSLQSVMPIIQAIMSMIRNTSGTPLATTASVHKRKIVINRKTHPLNKKYMGLLEKSLPKYSKAAFIDGGLITGPMLAAIAGPILQVLPSLLNQQNQARNQRELQEQNYLANLLAQSNQEGILRLLANNGALNQTPTAVSPALPAPTPITAPAAVPSATPPAPPASTGVATAESLSMNKRSPLISFTIDKQKGISINGSAKTVYNVTNDIALTIYVNTVFTPPQKPIPKVIIGVSIKKAQGLEELFSKKYFMKDVFLNSMQILSLSKDEIKNLPLNEDLLVDIHFKWLNKDQKVTSAIPQTCTIFLVNNYFMKGRESKIGDVLPLNDLDKFKVFWNKIWESSTTDGKKWEALFSVKYYTYYNIDADSNGKIETKLLLNNERADSDKRNYYNGKLKSGLEISPKELNKLIPMISNYKMLDEEQLKPFISNIMQNTFNKQATVNIEMKGNKEEIGSLWTYPEVNMAKYILYKPFKTNENGQVIEIEETEVFFPELQTIHFLGLKTNQIN